MALKKKVENSSFEIYEQSDVIWIKASFDYSIYDAKKNNTYDAASIL